MIGRYYTSGTAKARLLIRRQRVFDGTTKEQFQKEIDSLFLQDGDPNAVRMIKGGKYDGRIEAPWLLIEGTKDRVAASN